jgi:hypothetical protein
MPAFTFEKISPPERPAPIGDATENAVVRKPRGVIVQMLDRLVEARAKRALREKKNSIVRREPKPRD